LKNKFYRREPLKVSSFFHIFIHNTDVDMMRDLEKGEKDYGNNKS